MFDIYPLVQRARSLGCPTDDTQGVAINANRKTGLGKQGKY